MSLAVPALKDVFAMIEPAAFFSVTAAPDFMNASVSVASVKSPTPHGPPSASVSRHIPVDGHVEMTSVHGVS